MKDKKVRKYIILIVILLFGLLYVEMNRKEPVDWTPTFINTDKNPFGTYICFDLLKDVFSENSIRVSRSPITNELYYFDEDGFDNYSKSKKDGKSFYEDVSYIFITQSFESNYKLVQSGEVDKLDVKNLLSFVEEGNNAFIAAETISPLLLDTLKLKIETEWSSKDTTYVFNDFKKKKYSFRGIKKSLSYISKKDSCILSMHTLAESKNGKKTVFVKIKYGKGNLYLNTVPVAFSNIELLKLDKYDFAFTCLSYLPKTDGVIWDEYLKQGRIGESSPFRVVWNHPALLVAYCIALIGGLLFILFRSKRMQRVIPVIEPPKNTSLEFLDTISNLYYQKQAYESIVSKRHSYFLDTVRSRYYLRTEVIDDEFIKNLSLKSGVRVSIIENIFKLHNDIEHLYSVGNSLLLEYNEKLEEFYKEMK